MSFDILQHLERLRPDGGASGDKGDASFHCPVCNASNFKVNLKSGKWTAFGCDCTATDTAKRRVREKLSPAKHPDHDRHQSKPIRPRSMREWTYCDAAGTPILTVCRSDDGHGKRKIWQKSLVEGSRPADLSALAVPYKLRDVLAHLDANPDALAFWVEGEPAADALWAIGLPATTSIGGAGKFKPDRDGGHIPPHRLVVCPDQDQPGLRHAHLVADAHPGCQWMQAFPDQPGWNGQCPPDGGLDVADWIAAGATAQSIEAAIGPRPEPVAEPQGEAEGKQGTTHSAGDFIADARSLTDLLKAGLQRIDAEEDDDVRPFAHICLARELGLNAAQFNKLVLQLMNPAGSSMTAEQLLADDAVKVCPIIDDLLASGLTVLAGDGHAGKSTLAYQFAEAVANGSRFSDTFQAVKGNVLIIQMDEPAPVVRSKWRIMGARFPEGTVRVESQWNYHQLHRLRRWIKEHNAKLVIMDSLRTIAGRDVDAKDSDFGLMIYQLDQIASQSGISILVLHHVSKGMTPQRNASSHNDAFYEMHKEQMYGSTYVYNGCTDAFMYWSFKSDSSDEPQYALKCVRSRSGIPEIDIIHEFYGSFDDSRNYYIGIRGRTQTYSEAASKYLRVVSYLRSLDGRAVTAAEINRALQLGNVRYVGNILRKAYGREADLRRRSITGATAGRPGYAFWSCLGRLGGARSTSDPDEGIDPSCGEGNAAATAPTTAATETPSSTARPGTTLETPSGVMARLLGRS